MADLRDEHGNPIQLTDQHGNPVQLTDEFGNPMHLTGVAKTAGSGPDVGVPATGTLSGSPLGRTTAPAVHGGVTEAGPEIQQQQELRRSSSSSSSSGSSEDDGQGGRRKKKGLTQKIKEKLGGGKHKDKDVGEHAPTGTTTLSSTTTVTHSAHEHEKKGMMEKIKEKLPGHHNH
ncbi:late embryogenesis abundant protein-like [Cornus florida]|uniref:late embryogenesis abundant protein-like n=1 Tax=Cornus florida TaxID=4283 RepID=UPI0028A272F2|nr:late embryogenesis abundant protein-like [Cornus florida]